ncbi:MAG: globin domain-containing protein [Microscillaceae bacterium]|nr:globin domain-containing protein [Microscillaceae bacterium]
MANYELTPHQVDLIKNSWGKVIIYSEQAGEAFYTHLFAKAPELVSLFKTNIKAQDRKLIYAVTLLITKINKLDNIREEVRSLAKRHTLYGVKPEYFQVFGEAFMDMLDRVLQSNWNEDMQLAWRTLYGIIAQAIIDEMSTASLGV